MHSLSRRQFLKTSACSIAGAKFGRLAQPISLSTARGELPQQAEGVTVKNPQLRVPLSFIIDDSTCLVNMAHFGIPQFAEVFPDRYLQPWRELPREIPDTFVRSFGEWCRDHGVKGKYSIVPYPACVGWVDRFLPGWTKQELEDSLTLVRDFMVQDWDIHPEMISHTRVIDTRSGRPFPYATPDYMENWEWSQNKSADELADYIAYALRILKNAGLPCEGMTTPGGFGSRNQDNLALGTLEAVRDVYGAEVPHYFRDLFTESEESVAPRIYHASGLSGSDPRCVVSIIGCTGDWFGGWDGLNPGSADLFITEDLSEGRLVEVIDKGEPAVLVCHWPGIYYNGEEIGFNIFKEVVRRVHDRYDHLIWMKLSEIARYWATKELTHIEKSDHTVTFRAPFAASDFTVDVADRSMQPPQLTTGNKPLPLREVNRPRELVSGTWLRHADGLTVCFDLSKGTTELRV